MMAVLQLETSVSSGEAAIAAEMRERGDQALIDVERGQLVELLEQIGPLRHYLREQRYRLRRMLSHESAELRAAQKHAGRFLGSVRVCDVVAVWTQPFTSKRLARRRDHGHESTTNLDLVAKDYMAFENNEHAVCRRAALVELES